MYSKYFLSTSKAVALFIQSSFENTLSVQILMICFSILSMSSTSTTYPVLLSGISGLPPVLKVITGVPHASSDTFTAKSITLQSKSKSKYWFDDVILTHDNIEYPLGKVDYLSYGQK